MKGKRVEGWGSTDRPLSEPRWITLSLCTTLELVWPSLLDCSLSACTVPSPTMGPQPPRTWLWHT